MPKGKPTKTIVDFIRTRGTVRARDFDTQGVTRSRISRLVDKGVIVRVARGLYALPSQRASENQTLAEVSQRIPHGIVCLLSALRFHGITTQNPAVVWIAIDFKARKPKTADLPVRVVRFSGQALESGIDAHPVDRMTVRVFNPPKTVADCFKYRNKIGLDVAIEALRECLKQRKGTFDELWHYAKICRVANVMKPYLEASA